MKVMIKDIILGTEQKFFKELDFNLKVEKLKPVFTSSECITNYEFTCMLDSGAGIPVWCTGADALMDAFPHSSFKT